MSHSKKNFIPWRYALINIVLGVCVLLYPYFILKNFTFALCYIFLLSSFSSFNILCANKKAVWASFANTEDSKSDRFGRKPDIRILTEEFNFWSVLVILTVSITVYHVGAVIFGAPLLESFRSTLYFSVLMTIFTAYPLLWYFFFTDSITAVLKLLAESKFDSLTENQLHIIIIGTVLGAWIGAIPIPLDWDRPWQTWPITCCIGASIGNSASHFIIGLKLIYSYYKDRKKIALNRSV